MLREEKGPLILSATLHFLLLLAMALVAVASDDDEVEEVEFELYAGEFAEPGAGPALPMDPIDYRSEEVEVPTLDEIEFEPVEPKMIFEEPPPEETPEPVKEEPEPEPQVIDYSQFMRENPVRPKAVPQNRPRQVDISTSVNLRPRQPLPTTDITAPSGGGNSDALSAYYAGLKRAIAQNQEPHPVGSRKLETKIAFFLAATGYLTDVEILESSGDAAFDRKVVEAVRKLRRYKAPIDGQPRRLSLTIYQE